MISLLSMELKGSSEISLNYNWGIHCPMGISPHDAAEEAVSWGFLHEEEGTGNRHTTRQESRTAMRLWVWNHRPS